MTVRLNNATRNPTVTSSAEIADRLDGMASEARDKMSAYPTEWGK